MRRQIVAGNWKMNKTFDQAELLLSELAEKAELLKTDAELIICPPVLYMEMALDIVCESESENKFSVGAQDVSAMESGAYTGEISAAMLDSMGVEYCIVGHSERRKYHQEDEALIAKKVAALLACQIVPIVCCGETLAEREADQQLEVVKTQLSEALFSLNPLDFSKLIIAYEPVWAIGTGKTATPEQAQEMHAYIRSLIQEKFGKEVARIIPILYGGSCNPKNAKEIFAKEDVDGGLIGGASLVAEDFLSIANSF